MKMFLSAFKHDHHRHWINKTVKSQGACHNVLYRKQVFHEPERFTRSSPVLPEIPALFLPADLCHVRCLLS